MGDYKLYLTFYTKLSTAEQCSSGRKVTGPHFGGSVLRPSCWWQCAADDMRGCWCGTTQVKEREREGPGVRDS
jgi:hypothetical protein